MPRRRGIWSTRHHLSRVTSRPGSDVGSVQVDLAVPRRAVDLDSRQRAVSLAHPGYSRDSKLLVQFWNIGGCAHIEGSPRDIDVKADLELFPTLARARVRQSPSAAGKSSWRRTRYHDWRVIRRPERRSAKSSEKTQIRARDEPTEPGDESCARKTQCLCAGPRRRFGPGLSSPC